MSHGEPNKAELEECVPLADRRCLHSDNPGLVPHLKEACVRGLGDGSHDERAADKKHVAPDDDSAQWQRNQPRGGQRDHRAGHEDLVRQGVQERPQDGLLVPLAREVAVEPVEEPCDPERANGQVVLLHCDPIANGRRGCDARHGEHIRNVEGVLPDGSRVTLGRLPLLAGSACGGQRWRRLLLIFLLERRWHARERPNERQQSR
mmetsp:Transcript_14011/g.44881  ORF Transcript_14011/g.44881 Transcript_14011/m.44881 type:complete len:205 (+) Transcript_14011:334-948(+)